MRIPDNDEQSLSSSDGDVEALWVGEEAQVVAFVVMHQRLLRAIHGDDDDGALLQKWRMDE